MNYNDDTKKDQAMGGDKDKMMDPNKKDDKWKTPNTNTPDANKEPMPKTDK